MKKKGTRRRQQLVQHFLLCSVMFFRNSASACLLKGVLRRSTRSCTSSADILTLTSSVVAETAPRFASSLLTMTVALNWSPSFIPSGTATLKFWPRHATCTCCPGSTPGGTVTWMVCSSILVSIVSTAIRFPSSSVPHFTLNKMPCGDCASSSCPRGTATTSPVLSVISTGVLAAASFSACAAMERKTSSSVDIDSCTSVTPGSALRASSSMKRLVISASDTLGTSKCM
mmetsp:Transcript_32525/g.67218  ORF Transcript_32525/g.67218 Transcript_32525/m.67218 type:complete len:229 (+) Transcript_32525:2833-3519(+)